jgi:hypothetical protein
VALRQNILGLLRMQDEADRDGDVSACPVSSAGTLKAIAARIRAASSTQQSTGGTVGQVGAALASRAKAIDRQLRPPSTP